jgi:hypothetical protein
MEGDGNSTRIRTPWVSSSGEVSHPSSPRGAGGAGGFLIPKPFGFDGNNSELLPHPNSPAARNLIAGQLTHQIQVVDGGLAVNPDAGVSGIGGRDAGSAFVSGKDAGTATPDPPLFEDLDPSEPTKGMDGSCEYNFVERSHEYNYLGTSMSATATVRAGIQRGGKVTVGFIQNVLSQRVEAKYGKRPVDRWNVDKQLLDSLAELKEEEWPWIGKEPYVKTIDYQSGETVTLSYEDMPRAAYRNYYDNREENGELSWLKVSLELALWLAAKREEADGTKWKSYTTLWAIRFKYEVKLTITESISALRAAAKRKGQDFSRTFGTPKYEFETKLGPPTPVKNLTPVLKGPIANTELSLACPKTIFAPLRPLKGQ